MLSAITTTHDNDKMIITTIVAVELCAPTTDGHGDINNVLHYYFCIVAESVCVCVVASEGEKNIRPPDCYRLLASYKEVGETTKKTHTLYLCVRARVFGKLPSQPVECNDGSTTLRVRGGGARGGSEMAGGIDGRTLWCGAVAEGPRKKGNGPVPTVRCLGRPVSVRVCVCARLCVPLRCCVGGACVKGKDKGFLIYFFFTSLFSLSPPPPQSPHPYDTRRRGGTPALSPLFLVAVHKRDAPAAQGRKIFTR